MLAVVSDSRIQRRRDGSSPAIKPRNETAGGSSMAARQKSGDPNAVDRFVELDDGDLRVVEDGEPDAPVLLLLTNAVASVTVWDPVVPLLARTFRVIRVDLLVRGRSTIPVGGYDVPAQARRVGAVLDRLGVRRLTVLGHSSGCMVATALAEQRTDAVVALALIDMGPDLDAKIPENLVGRLLLAPVTGPLLWRLRTESTIRRAARTGFTRPVEIPDDFFVKTLAIAHRTFVEIMHAYRDFLEQQSLADRLIPLGLAVLVVFGGEDRRWRSSSAAAYRVVPGVRIEVLPGLGHIPMMEDPQATGGLLLDFAAAAGRPRQSTDSESAGTRVDGPAPLRGTDV
jgi:pimeloyl-ACP methyl ester carboxylesterase